MENEKMFFYLSKINECETISQKIEIANSLIIHSSFLETGNMLSQFANKKIVNKNGLELFLAYKCGKGDLSDLFVDADCDVSLIPMIVYCNLLNIEPNEKCITFQTKCNSQKYKYEIIQTMFSPFRGDTMTSIQYCLKKHIALLWKELNEHPKLLEDEVYKNFYALFNGLSNRGLLFSDIGNWDDVFYKYSTLIWEVLDDEIKIFLSKSAWSIGNFIPMPIYINPSRNDVSGTIDTADTLLWNIYIYYQLKGNETAQKEHVQRILNGKYKNEAIENYIRWLDFFKTWDNFVEQNCLQDFVQNFGHKKYGCPYSLKTNKIINCPINEKYIPMATSYNESRNFFKTLNEKILKRNQRISSKVKKILYERIK